MRVWSAASSRSRRVRSHTTDLADTRSAVPALPMTAQRSAQAGPSHFDRQYVTVAMTVSV